MSDRQPAVDLTALDRLLDMTGGDVEFLDELVETYLADGPVQLGAMREAALNGSAGGLIRPSHSLKSNSANLGAAHLADLCRVLEATARDGVVDGAIERVAAAEAEFEEVRAALLAVRANR
ncbi:MAG: Hpt domain-containing protein [Chloroflexi bacterium]|nr:Hpt domain-containing protein [Chloroflexota bacterium]